MSALAGIVIHLEALRLEAGLSMQEVCRLAEKRREWYSKVVRERSGPILDTINEAAKVYGYRLALVPIDEQEETA